MSQQYECGFCNKNQLNRRCEECLLPRYITALEAHTKALQENSTAILRKLALGR